MFKSTYSRRAAWLIVPVLLVLVACVRASFAKPTTARSDTPESWTMYAMVPGHNAWYASSFPAVSWSYDVPGAAEAKASGLLNPTMVRDIVGFAVGVAVVGDTVYATNDDGYLYAVDIRSGRLRWRFHAFNQLMGTPVVAKLGARTLVFVGAGNSTFAYSHAVNFADQGMRVVRGNGLSAIFAVDATTGKLVWSYRTEGEDMPTPVLYGGRLLFGNGDGHVYSLDAFSGKLMWKTYIHSFVSMSSTTLDPIGGAVVVGGTWPSRIYAVDAQTGKQKWSVVPPNVFSSSAGDGTWAIYADTVVGQIETQSAGQAKTNTATSEELAIGLKTGRIVWSTALGTGKVPPRNKDAVPTVVGAEIFTGSPVTHSEYALDAASGHILWQRHLNAGMKAAPTVIGNTVVQPVANGALVMLNRRSGDVQQTVNLHQGGYGPQNAVVIGRTLFIGTNAGVLQAIPLTQLGIHD